MIFADPTEFHPDNLISNDLSGFNGTRTYFQTPKYSEYPSASPGTVNPIVLHPNVVMALTVESNALGDT